MGLCEKHPKARTWMIDGYGDNRRMVCPACMGASRSKKKRAAARENGKLGGRPSKAKLAAEEAKRAARAEQKERRKRESYRWRCERADRLWAMNPQWDPGQFYDEHIKRFGTPPPRG